MTNVNKLYGFHSVLFGYFYDPNKLETGFLVHWAA